MEKNFEEEIDVKNELIRANPGDIVPGFSFPNNAQIQGDFLYLRDAKGNIIDGKVTVGDHITVLRVIKEAGLALVQYPVGSRVKEGYVTNATNIIKYYNQDQWVNKNSKTTVHVVASTGSTETGYLNPNERATFLFRQNGMDNVVYNASGTRNKSGFVDFNGSGTGSGSGSGTSGENPWPNVAPGSVVPGGFTFSNNAKLVGGSLQLKDANGNNVSGTVSNGDSITVLDVGHSKQLTLVQYPAGGAVKQGYVSNDTNLIRYNNEYDWYNGSSKEPVYSKYNSGDSDFGTLSPRESATKLYEYNGRVHVVYDTTKGMLTKSGYVSFKGNEIPPRHKLDLGSIGHSKARLKVYGKSGNGYNLNSYKLGASDEPGKKIKKIFVGFAIHGWEDHWRFDGEALVKIGSSVLNKLGNYINEKGSLNGWQVCLAPCMNPDGLIAGRTSFGPGRCTVTTKIDMNRCFPYNFPASSAPRYYTGSSPLGAPEAVALKNLVTELANESSELIVIDCHGWLGFTQGNPEVGKYFTKQFGFDHKTQYSGGFFSVWANSLSNTKGVLLEYPQTTADFTIIESYATKTFNGIMEIINGSSGNGGNNNGGTVTGEEVFNRTGKIINVESELNVRSGPGTSYSAIGKLYGGNAVTIVARVKPSGESLYWYKIKNGSGTGYVRSDFVQLNSDSSAGEEQFNRTGKIINVESELNVRSGPGTSYNGIGKLYGGNAVTIVARVKPSGENLYWYKINYQSGTGYVRSDFVQLTGAPYRVRKSWADAASQKGAYSDLANAKAECDKWPGYHVFDNDGNLMYSNKEEVTGAPYRVRKSWADAASQKGAYNDLANAKAECDKWPGYHVFDNNGKLIYSNKNDDVILNGRGTVYNLNNTTLKVTNTPSTTGTVIDELRNGQVIKIIGIEGYYYKILTSSALMGYANMSYIKFSNDGTSTDFSRQLVGVGTAVIKVEYYKDPWLSIKDLSSFLTPIQIDDIVYIYGVNSSSYEILIDNEIRYIAKFSITDFMELEKDYDLKLFEKNLAKILPKDGSNSMNIYPSESVTRSLYIGGLLSEYKASSKNKLNTATRRGSRYTFRRNGRVTGYMNVGIANMIAPSAFGSFKMTFFENANIFKDKFTLIGIASSVIEEIINYITDCLNKDKKIDWDYVVALMIADLGANIGGSMLIATVASFIAGIIAPFITFASVTTLSIIIAYVLANIFGDTIDFVSDQLKPLAEVFVDLFKFIDDKIFSFNPTFPSFPLN